MAGLDQKTVFARDLGNFEQTWALMDDFAPVLFVGILHLSNAPAPEVVRMALDTLQARHPLLRVAIAGRGGAVGFAEAAEPRQIPLATIARTDADHWRGVVEDELITPMETSRPPLLRCTYVHGDGDSEFVFTLHHAIIDSRSGMALVHQLLTLCDEAKSGQKVAAQNAPLSPLAAMEDLYPPRYRGWRGAVKTAGFAARQAYVEAGYRLRLKGRQQIPANLVSPCRVLGFEFSRSATRSLVRQTRKRRIPLNSILHAAMLASVARHRYRDLSLPMRGISFADMRPHLVPPPSEEDLGVYISMLPYTVDVVPDQDIWNLAGRIGDQVYRATKHGDKFIAPVLGKHLVKMLVRRRSMRLGMIALSYVGPLNLLKSYGNIKVRSLSGFVANNGLGPELAAFGALVQDRLKMDFLYLDADMNEDAARQIVADIESQLSKIIERVQRETT